MFSLKKNFSIICSEAKKFALKWIFRQKRHVLFFSFHPLSSFYFTVHSWNNSHYKNDKLKVNTRGAKPATKIVSIFIQIIAQLQSELEHMLFKHARRYNKSRSAMLQHPDLYIINIKAPVNRCVRLRVPNYSRSLSLK